MNGERYFLDTFRCVPVRRKALAADGKAARGSRQYIMFSRYTSSEYSRSW